MDRRTRRRLWRIWEYIKVFSVTMFAMAAGAACYHQYLVQNDMIGQQEKIVFCYPAAVQGQAKTEQIQIIEEPEAIEVPEVIEMQSEGGAAGALHGALQQRCVTAVHTVKKAQCDYRWLVQSCHAPKKFFKEVMVPFSSRLRHKKVPSMPYTR